MREMGRSAWHAPLAGLETYILGDHEPSRRNTSTHELLLGPAAEVTVALVNTTLVGPSSSMRWILSYLNAVEVVGKPPGCS